MFTDAHYADIPDNGNRNYSQSLLKMRESIDTFNFHKAAFAVELGDFKDMSQPANSAKTLAFLRKAENVFSTFKGRRYHVLGNHDQDCITKQQFNAVARSSYVGGKRNYYSFDRGGFHFVVLDACFDSLGHDYANGKYLWSDANIPDKELSWLRNDLRNSLDPVIVFSHQLLDLRSNIAVRNAWQVRQILESHGRVMLVMQGHYHEGLYSYINGIHYYTLRGMVEGKYPAGNSYALVDIGDGMIKIRGFRNSVSMQLPVHARVGVDDYHLEGEYDWEPWEEQ